MAEQRAAMSVVGDLQWRRRVEQEYKAEKGWEGDWGFLKGAQMAEESKGGDALDNFVDEKNQVHKKIKSDFKGKAQQLFEAGKEHERRTMCKSKSERDDDAMEQFMTNVNKKYKLVHKHDPQKEYGSKLLTSHEYGWNGTKTLEQFGQIQLRMR
mmetsp:Transcript_16565/g.22875  ORF Transcript_16565/g.22875 Transcript_16565/m.22875 type:complete len:154 (+) Transcript_16565:291-752(+)|eukprot:CAMPEP_0196584848 /NCGR_PEP_ID=MMETSP1081-20130531/48705_1 /TAXON_ID=36882 /ORGANISM="Pyramimonas amylifera, Strain CCMP720" /LENGTH=153 /DNA_ID=CAMNT_0041906205 /DNA_START=272 /DNA_END=733 /DNA_ORIENTATION=+